MVEFNGLPEKPFFSCSESGFDIVDTQQVKYTTRFGKVEPWMSFKSGPGCIFESRPRSVLAWDHRLVSVECDSGHC